MQNLLHSQTKDSFYGLKQQIKSVDIFQILSGVEVGTNENSSAL